MYTDKNFTSPPKYTIPSKERVEWEMLVTSQIEHKFSNFVLQLKSSEYRRKIAAKTLSIEEAIDELYELCSKYAIAVQEDFKQIFKTW
ncbi:hypothetical protein Fleli_1147 [Bernardetia litoralis DSM 6794]|uniref:Uncharacterized protein n=1 Tax=Bernardetia litoralis (strain ATCC 23117 / DSM 6794 / NBRC 15988 / NCIMB 1366 / Fx l1 / Sio-4) TaxID=880071 RepID=I4AI00_BERLS|nr:hypothetical protein [Bernardetia litoralis]AFM03585.1 hypothetical protein Fleli_1147 [Bernardetia litoralis DSM 6794]